MTKRIIALALVLVFACTALLACDTTEPTKTTTPAGTTAAPTGTAGTTPEGTTSSSDATPTPTECAHEDVETVGAKQPTETEEGYTGDVVCKICKETIEEGSFIPPLDDGYMVFGGLENEIALARWFNEQSTAFEVWPNYHGQQYNVWAFYQSCIQWSKDEFDGTLGIDNLADYQYVYKWRYRDITEEDNPEWSAQWTPKLETIGAAGDPIYRFQVTECAEGDMFEAMKPQVGRTYEFGIEIYDKTLGEVVDKDSDSYLGFVYLDLEWRQVYDDSYNVYNKFWTLNNREDGIGANTATESPEFKAYAEECGFVLDAEGNYWNYQPQA